MTQNKQKRPDWPFRLTFEEALWIYKTFVGTVSLESYRPSCVVERGNRYILRGVE